MESFCVDVASVASGTDKTAINIFNPAASPTTRFGVYEVIIGSSATPDDQAASFFMGRTTAVGTEGSGLVPNNIDPGGPAGACDSGLGVFSVEPTYTAAKQLMRLPLNMRTTAHWRAFPGKELRATATQNNGIGIKTSASSSTQAHGCCVWFTE